MRINVISDAHLEHQLDGGVKFLSKLDPTGVGVLVIAGDFGNYGGYMLNNLMAGLHQVCKLYPHVVYVTGNHDHWGVDKDELTQAIKDFKKDGHKNFHFLDNSSVIIDGQRFIGSTLWYIPTPIILATSHTWIDFHMIPNFRSWWLAEAEKTQNYLKKNIKKGDVVVTHMCPSWQSLNPHFAGQPTNDYFIIDMSKTIMNKKPALWLHGHTHHSFDYTIGDTRVVCNPYGYESQDYGLNPEFTFSKFVDI